ncbi:hypothetical protein [Limosilactobacillus equigenerosi]|nr:hypothetical protein [Limosilactobacillus equigenerosi]
MELQEFTNGSIKLPVKEVNGDIYIDAEKASIGNLERRRFNR